MNRYLPVIAVALLVFGCEGSSDPTPEPVVEEPEPEQKLVQITATNTSPLAIYVKWRPVAVRDLDFFTDDQPWAPGESHSTVVLLDSQGYEFHYWTAVGVWDPVSRYFAENNGWLQCPTCCPPGDPCQVMADLDWLAP